VARGSLDLLSKGRAVGRIELRVNDQRLTGRGTLYGTPVTITGTRRM
jgi:hypothetical protein